MKYLLSIFCLYSVTLFAKNDDPTRLLFCYEDKELAPYFLGIGAHTPPDKPGASIELLQHITQEIPHLSLTFIRQPWKRCLNDLKNNKVDAIIASHQLKRETLGVYPKLNNQIDPSRALSAHGTCFIKRSETPLLWDGQSLSGLIEPTIALPSGYSSLEQLEQLPVKVVQTDSANTAHRLLKEKRVDLALSLCKISEKSPHLPQSQYAELEIIFPPLVVKHGYLVFSYRFYDTQSHIAETLWQKIITLDTTTIFNRYLDSSSSDLKK